MIKDVILRDLKIHQDERGKLFEILRSDDEFFLGFGQAYITVCFAGWVKAWHYHKIQSDTFCLVRGKAKIVLYDTRKDSVTYKTVEEYTIRSYQPQILRIPKEVVHGFECLGKKECWILNLPDKIYNPKEPDEYRISISSDEVPYQPWKDRKGW